MNIGKILKKVGSAVIREAVPGGGLVLDAINAFLPEEKRLGPDATGAQAEAAVGALPPDQRAMLMAKELDVEIAEINSWTAVVESLARADASGSSTRPRIAVMMAQAVVFAVIAATAAWVIAVLWGKKEMIEALNDSWPLLVAILATPTALLRAYFGMRRDEKKARYSAATGGQVPPGGLLAGLAGVLKRNI